MMSLGAPGFEHCHARTLSSINEVCSGLLLNCLHMCTQGIYTLSGVTADPEQVVPYCVLREQLA